MQNFKTIAALLTLCVFLSSADAQEEWGTLKGKFVYDGKLDPVEIKPTKDVEFCGKHKIIDETLVVGKDGGVRDLFVFLYLGRSEKKPDAHPSYAKSAKAKIELANKGCSFGPHAVLLRTTQTLSMTNPDEVAHNTKIDCFKNTPINPLIPAGGKLDQKFEIAESLPVPVGCNIHPWMTARMLVKDHPYMAATDANGEFEIKNVPAGDWTFRFYHERAGYVQKVTIDGKKSTWLLGRKKLSFANGETTDIGTVTLAPEIFEKD